MQWVALVYAVSIGSAITLFSFAYKDRTGWYQDESSLGARLQILVCWSPLILWPAWAFLSLIWALISDGDLLPIWDEASVLLFSIIFAGVAFCWNLINIAFPGAMIGIGVYRFASNDYSLTPFHYFFDLNSWLVTGLFAERPLPVYIVIQIQLIIGLSLFGMVGRSISSKN